MTTWACDRCGWTIDQPDCVVSIGHRCNPRIPNTWRQLRRQIAPSTDGGNQGKPEGNPKETTMPIEDPTPTTAGAPVLSRRAIGQKFKGVTCLMPETRDRLKYDPETGTSKPMLKPDGKARQELVVTMMTIASTMPTGKIDEPSIPAEGDIVRVILKGKAFGDWIDAAKELGHKPGVGYIVEMDTTFAQVYDENGHPTGGELTTQTQADAVPRGRSLGYYGPIVVRVPATADEVAWDTKACKFYNDSQRPEVPAAEFADAPF